MFDVQSVHCSNFVKFHRRFQVSVLSICPLSSVIYLLSSAI